MGRTVMDLTPEEFSDLINNKRGNSSRSNSKDLPDFSSMVPGVNLFKTAIEQTADFTGKVMTGSATALDAMKGITEISKTIPVFGHVTNVLGKFGEGVFKVNDMVNGLNTAGISYKNDLGLFSEQALNSRMGLEGWTKMLNNNAENLSRMGMTAGQGAINFGKLSEAMMKDADAMNMRISLGKDADEQMNNSLMLIMSSRMKVDMGSQQSIEATTKSAIALASELDQVAKLTGKNKDTLKKEMQAQMDRADIQMRLLRMSEDQQKAYVEMMGGMGKAPKQVQDLLSELVATGGNIKTAQGRATFTAMGSENGAALATLVDKMKTATGPELAELKKERDALIERVNERIRSDSSFSTMGNYNTGILGDTARGMMETSAGIKGDVAKLQDKIDQARIAQMSPEELSNEKRKTAANEQFGKDANGNNAPGAIIGQTINTLDGHVKTLSAAMGKSFREMSDSVGTNAGLFKNVNEQMALFRNLKPEEVSKFVTQAVNSMKADKTANPADTQGINGYNAATGKWNTSVPKTPANTNLTQEQGALKAKATVNTVTNANTGSQTTNTASSSSENVLMSDLKELFTTLNTKLGEVVTHTSGTVEKLEKQINVLSSMSGNRLSPK
jgi:hypothetical protein